MTQQKALSRHTGTQPAEPVKVRVSDGYIFLAGSFSWASAQWFSTCLSGVGVGGRSHHRLEGRFIGTFGLAFRVQSGAHTVQSS